MAGKWVSALCDSLRLSGLSCCEWAKQTRLGNTTPAPAWTDLEDTLLSTEAHLEGERVPHYLSLKKELAYSSS